MVYISSDGGVTERRTKWRWSIITDLFQESVNFVLVFFRSMTHGTDAIQNVRHNYHSRSAATNTYASRRRGPNIRNVSRLGSASQPLSG